MAHLHIKDCIEKVKPGGIIRPPSDDGLDSALARIVGPRAASIVLDAVGENGVLTYSEAELVTMASVPRSVARRIVAAREFGETLTELAFPEASRPSQLLRLLPRGLRTLEFEVLLAVLLDGKLGVRSILLLAKGGMHGAAIRTLDLFTPIVRLGAAGVILVHNHPSSDPTPSEEDIALTNHAMRAAAILGINFLDHIIVARGGTTSLRETGLLLNNDELNVGDFIAE